MGQVTNISFLLLVTLTAKVCSNMVPVLTTEALVYISEDIPVGAFAFQINATDSDGDTLEYGLSGTDSFYFTVDAGTGLVTVKNPLDREITPVLSFSVTVTDNVYPLQSKDIAVVVNDANDNFPIFEGSPYNVQIRENASLGTEVIRVTANDADSGTAGTLGLTYSISGVSPPEGMALFQIVPNSGIISLAGELSFTEKSTFYQLNVTATDGGGPLNGVFIKQSRSTFVFVAVVDVANLDPVFLNLPSAATVDEGSALGTPVFTVRARDPDTGVNSPILYSITKASVNDLFQIDATSGIITVKSTLNREEHLVSDGVISLEIEAKETIQNVNGINAAVISEIDITIGDINDEKPEFYICNTPEICVAQLLFTGNIDEHSAGGLPVLGVNMAVIDKDKGVNSEFLLSLEGAKKGAFSVSPARAVSKADVQILVRNPAEIDYEVDKSTTLMVIAVDAKDDTFKSTATVTITINDVNDNVPKFPNETYSLDIEEHSPAGTVIATITATDPDTDDVGKLEYRLLPESIAEYFDVNHQTGVITVQNADKLDRESRSLYFATLQAKDTANNIGTAILEITLLDKNDQAPTMIRDSYIAFVNEGPGVDFELKIQATDNDQPDTDNSKIEYQIVPGDFSNNFTLNKDTGVLTLANALDREALDPALDGVIKLNVTAFDKGTPPLGTWAIVEINVGDINDNGPHFQKKEYDFTVKEGEQGAYINSVFATDMDQTQQNNRISFRITGGGAGIFSVRSVETPDKTGYWGNISVDQESILDYETRKEYTISVLALDPEQKMDTTTVHISVEDVNDETPSLPEITFSVKENTTLGEEGVGMIVGVDKDTKHELEYTLLSTECPCNKSGVCQDEWFLVDRSGKVTLNPEYVVDYELCNQVILHVQVTDILTEMGKNSTEGTITVNIEDINDNAPEFIQIQPNFVVLAESTEVDTSVAIVSASDRDSGVNTQMTFEVLEVTFINSVDQTEDKNKVFKADNQPQPPSANHRSAIIRSIQSLDAEKKGKYVVTVQVTDSGKLSSTSEVVIFTVDKSYKVALDFRSTVEDFNANSDTIKWALESATGTTVHIIRVSAKTVQRNTDLTVVEAYFIYPNGTALEHITVINMVNGNPNTEYRDTLFANGLTGVNAGDDNNQGEVNTELYILMGLAGGLAIVLIVMTTLLVFMRRNYQRKLKAAKAMNSATMTTGDNQKSGPVVPGTNKYTMEGANPVLNLNIDTTTDLGFDEEDSNADRSSLNSLDDMNSYMNMSDKDTVPMMVIEEENEENGPDSSYSEPLGAALAQRGKRRGNNNSPPMTFDNPGLSTTDL